MAQYKQQRGLFIVGTDTGVGKTVIGSALARAYHLQGKKVYPRKPIETGCALQNGVLLPSDGLQYAAAVNQSCSIESITPYCFEATVSAERAARLEGKKLNIDDLKNAVLKDIPNDGVIIAEGAGGLYSPLASDGHNADLAAALGLPLILVVADRLGCINHALLTLEALEKRQFAVAAVVLNNADQISSSSMDNFADLRARTNAPLYRFPDQSLQDSTELEVLITHLESVMGKNEQI